MKEVLSRYNWEEQRRVYKNGNWNDLVDFNTENLRWTTEKSIKTYHLKSE